MDIVVDAVQEAGDDYSGETFKDSLDIVEFVDFAGAHRVVTEGAHGPAHRTVAFDEFGVEALLALSHALFVGNLGSFFDGEAFFVTGYLGNGHFVFFFELGGGGKGWIFLFFLDNGVVGHVGAVSVA